MPRVESDIFQPLKGAAYRPLAIHAGAEVSNAVKSEVQTAITFPMLVDIDQAVLRAYSRIGSGDTVFPLGYLLDKQGIIRHIYAVTEPPLDQLRKDIDALLAE